MDKEPTIREIMQALSPNPRMKCSCGTWVNMCDTVLVDVEPKHWGFKTYKCSPDCVPNPEAFGLTPEQFFIPVRPSDDNL